MPNQPNQPNIKDAIKTLIEQCAADPIFFIRHYVKIKTEDKGILPFETFAFQDQMLQDFHDHNRIIILKSRQMGISTLIAAYVLWVMVFHEGKNTLIVSIKESTAMEIISKIQLAYEKLPPWLKKFTQGVKEMNKHSIRFNNMSMVLATSSASDSTRSFSASFIIFDEAAFIDDIDELWTSAQPTLSTVSDGKAIILSTPNGMGGFFHNTWVKAESKINGFHPIKLPWHLRPDRDKVWYNTQIEDMGIKKFGQEYDCDFLASGNSVIDLFILKEYEDSKVKNRPDFGIKPPKDTRYGQELWVWKDPEKGRDYIVCADVARGDGADKSAFHVLDVETLEQVAEYQGFIDTETYGNRLVAIATEYNHAMLIVENATWGWAVLQTIVDQHYDNTFYSTADLKIIEVERQRTTKYNREERQSIPGFTMTQPNRQLIINKMEAYFRERSIDIKSLRTINELKTFIWEKGKAQAAEGYNDDLTMALGIGLWVRDMALRLREEGIVLTKSMIDGIKVVKNDESEYSAIYKGRSAMTNGLNPWQMKTGAKPGSVEDLTWLLR
jgi:hypothetical protein